MAIAEQSRETLPMTGLLRLIVLSRTPPAFLCAFFFLLALGMQSFRITQTPDLFADEGLYYSVGRNIAAGQGLIENSGAVFVWHPPFYLLLEAAYLKVFGLVDAQPIIAIAQLRMINAVAAAITAALIFAIGRRLRGQICGSTTALLFCLDPYVQRINRRNMLETVAMLLVVAGLYVYLKHMHTRQRWFWRACTVGVAFGLATLTKEIMFFGILILALFALLFRRDHIPRVAVSAIVTILAYSIYPIWMFLSGYGADYNAMKEHQVVRLFGQFLQQTPTSASELVARPVSGGNVGIWENLSATLQQYGSSYLVIALGAVIVLLFIIRLLPFVQHKHQAKDYLLIMWLMTSYGCIGASIFLGRPSDQFFYFLIVPAVVLVGCAITPVIEQLWWLWWGYWHDLREPIDGWFNYSRITGVLVLWVILIGIIWNMAVYINFVILGKDNSYAALYQYVARNVPPGSTIVAGSDLANYIFPNYRVRFYRSQEEVQNDQVRYFIFSSKEVWGGYNNVTPQFYDWVTAKSEVRFEQYGATFWDLKLYEMPRPEKQH